MPTSAELCDAQYEFELPRGLLNHNTGEFALHRMCEEVGEAWHELDTQNYLAMLVELADVVIFAHSIIGDLCRKLDLPYEQVDQIIQDKMERNHQKYALEHFEGRSVSEAIAYSRKVWNKD